SRTSWNPVSAPVARTIEGLIAAAVVMSNRAARRLTSARSIMWWETPVIGRPSWGNGNGKGASTQRSHVAERHVAAAALDQRLVARLRGGHAVDRRAPHVVEQEQRARVGLV